MTDRPVAEQMADDYHALISVAWLNGALAMRFRIARLLSSMGEHELAAQVAVMGPPTRENWDNVPDATPAGSRGGSSVSGVTAGETAQVSSAASSATTSEEL